MDYNKRNRRLYARAKKCLYGNIEEYSGQKLIIPSRYTYKGVWNWDSMFHALAFAEWDKEIAIQQIRFFTERQSSDGKYCDAVLFNGKVYDTISKPPVISWVLYRIAKRYGYFFDLEYFYNSLTKNVAFWEKKRLKNGMFGYDAECDEDYYSSQCKNESGWDTSVRWDEGAENIWAVDLNCFMVITYGVLVEFANKLGKSQEESLWKEKHDNLARDINEKLWSDRLGAYCDFNFVNGSFTDVLSPASFFPLFAEIAAKDRADKMKEIAESDDFFYPLFPTVSYNNKEFSSFDYWRGPTWLNVAYFALSGLKKYGYNELYNKYKDNILNACDAEKRGIFEYYDSRSGKGLGAKQFGWSSVFIIEFIKEIV